MEIDVGDVVLQRFVSEGKRLLVDPGAVAEAIRVAEASVAVLRDELHRLHDRAERLSRFALAAVAGVLAVLGLVNAYGVPVSGLGRLLISSGTALIVLSVVVLSSLVAGVGQGSMADWPRVESMIARLQERQLSRVELQWSLLQTLARVVGFHERVQTVGVRRLAGGYGLLVLGGMVFLVGLAFIVGGLI